MLMAITFVNVKIDNRIESIVVKENMSIYECDKYDDLFLEYKCTICLKHVRKIQII